MSLARVVDLRPSESAAVMEIEQSLLGIALFENAAVGSVRAVKPEHFSEPLHGRIWAVIAAIAHRGEPADPVLVLRAMETDPALAEAGGARFLADLVDHAPPSSSTAAYASAIIDAWGRRRILAIWAEVQSEVQGGASPRETSARLRAALEAAEAELERPAPLLRPYQWRPGNEIPPRDCLYGRHYFRRYVSTTVAPAGTGKSALAIVEALAMATAKRLLGIQPHEPLRVAYFNLEDPLEETERRVAAAVDYHRLDGRDLEGRLWWGSGRDAGITLAEMSHNGAIICQTDVRRLKEAIKKAALDVIIIDPFVSSHRVAENDNAAIDLVVKTLAAVADECGLAIELIHHPRKPSPGQDVGVDDSRGASALLAAVRSARTLNVMTDKEAGEAGIETDRRRYYFRSEIGKSNLGPPPERATWFRLESIWLGNGPDGSMGDSVGVVVPWEWPNPLEGVSAGHIYHIQQCVDAEGDYRESSQAKKWIGHLVAVVLGLDLGDSRQHAKVKSLLKIWFENGVLVVERRKDASRQERPFVSVGKWVTP
jgi:hypothetical protein